LPHTKGFYFTPDLTNENRMRPMIQKSDDHESKFSKGNDVKVTFGWKNISYSIPTKDGTKNILQNVSGFLESGTSPQARY
jgi:hypothetical protein